MLIDLNLLHSELNLIVNAERQVHLVSSALFVDERDCTIENITHETTDIAVGNLQLKLSLNYGFIFSLLTSVHTPVRYILGFGANSTMSTLMLKCR